MKKLYLVRHAKSSWKYPDLDDFERPLNIRGRYDAPRVGHWLKNKQIRPDIVISSPASRAAMTARIIAEIIGYPVAQISYMDQIYEGGFSELMNVISLIDERFTQAFLVGHNPGLTFLANSLGDSPVQNISTCSIFALDLTINKWKAVDKKCGKCIFYQSPKEIS